MLSVKYSRDIYWYYRFLFIMMQTSFCSGGNSSLDICCPGRNNWNSLYVNGKFNCCTSVFDLNTYVTEHDIETTDPDHLECKDSNY